MQNNYSIIKHYGSILNIQLPVVLSSNWYLLYLFYWTLLKNFFYFFFFFFTPINNLHYSSIKFFGYLFCWYVILLFSAPIIILHPATFIILSYWFNFFYEFWQILILFLYFQWIKLTNWFFIGDGCFLLFLNVHKKLIHLFSFLIFKHIRTKVNSNVFFRSF